MRQRTPLTKVVAAPPNVAERKSRPEPGIGTVPGAGRTGPGETEIDEFGARPVGCCARAAPAAQARAARKRAAANLTVMTGRVLPNARDLVKASGLQGRLELAKRLEPTNWPIPWPLKVMKMSPGMTEILNLLSKRRSVPPISLSGPGPSADELTQILTIGARVPDHGKLAPWRFIIFQGAARERAGQIVAAGFKRREPQADETRISAEAKRMTMAPLIIGVVSTAKEGAKVPAWEQELSAGAVCMNLLLAAKGLGFDGSWLTNWFSYDREVLLQFGLREGERMAGFIHLGRAAQAPDDRPRPDLNQIVTHF